MTTMFEDLLKTINELKINQPPKREIWLMKIMPYKDDNGDPVIMKINLHQMQQSFYGSITPNAINFPKPETVTGADEVIIMNPLTFDDLAQRFENRNANQIIASVYSIPVFDDEYRQNYFASKGRQSDG